MSVQFLDTLLAIVCGLAAGAVLNLSADRFPWRDGSARETPQPLLVNRQRMVRWTGLLLFSLLLSVHLQSRYGWSLAFAVQGAYCGLLLLVAVIDLEHRLVPNKLILVGLGLALGASLVSLDGPVGPGVVAALTGAAVGGGLFVLLALAGRNALGWGDVKLAFLIGTMTGFPWVVQALVLGILLGGLAAGLLLLLRLRASKEYIPYAPYLVAGALVTLLHGQDVALWYARATGVGG